MTIHVLGLGETISTYRSIEENKTVGVNDIFKYHPVQHLILADPPQRFREPDRYKTIIESTPEKFYCPDVWEVPNFVRIELSKGRGNCQELDSDRFPFSNNSPFLACVLSYKLGAKKIIMYGVDFKSHNVLSTPNNHRIILEHFQILKRELNRRGVFLSVSHAHSLLSQVLPIL